jgi:3-oxoacyl-[acyl-carrier protein] reductase
MVGGKRNAVPTEKAVKKTPRRTAVENSGTCIEKYAPHGRSAAKPGGTTAGQRMLFKEGDLRSCVESQLRERKSRGARPNHGDATSAKFHEVTFALSLNLFNGSLRFLARAAASAHHPSMWNARNVLVFGATGGLGGLLARRLVAAGARVTGTGRDESKLAELEAAGIRPVRVDATEPSHFKQAVESATEGEAPLDGMACCIGSILLKPAHLTRDEDFLSVLQTNLHAPFFAVREAAAVMSRRGGGSIVLVSSVAARIGLANHEAIAAAKAGVQGLTLSAAASYAPRKIRVNCVAPGLTLTPLGRSLPEAALKVSEQMHPLKRLGEASEVVSALEWFLSPEQGWVTGQILGVDGGLGSLRAQG